MKIDKKCEINVIYSAAEFERVRQGILMSLQTMVGNNQDATNSYKELCEIFDQMDTC
uniref:Uncharacterized protein n=1 Tax=viral metagenome TaxID=1070528 RepID=A0A6M3Y5R6_9ZZZZ